MSWISECVLAFAYQSGTVGQERRAVLTLLTIHPWLHHVLSLFVARWDMQPNTVHVLLRRDCGIVQFQIRQYTHYSVGLNSFCRLTESIRMEMRPRPSFVFTRSTRITMQIEDSKGRNQTLLVFLLCCQYQCKSIIFAVSTELGYLAPPLTITEMKSQ